MDAESASFAPVAARSNKYTQAGEGEGVPRLLPLSFPCPENDSQVQLDPQDLPRALRGFDSRAAPNFFLR
jgi:hypothetical protein